jgi:V/A-type H+-transporting ATPase subunit I
VCSSDLEVSTAKYTANSPSDVAHITPPTLLSNFFLFRPFEQFVTMYGLPQYNEVDPTPFLALTYILFFGIMFGDLGQGLVISLAGLLAWKLKGINLGRIACILGFSSAVFGCLFGSVFGLEGIIAGYNPLEHINTVLIFAVGLGALTVSGAAAINIANGIKQKNPEKALFSQNGLAGLVFYWAVITAGLVTMKFLPPGISAAALFGLAAFCAALIYLKEPLANLILRKPEIIPQNPGEFFVTGLFELFEIVLSFLTNTISFIRVGAFALNHVGMMSVVMMLSRTASGKTNFAILAIGNIIVIALEGLIVGIQCLRLQYYEIFGRFFAGSGRVFAGSEFKNKKQP